MKMLYGYVKKNSKFGKNEKMLSGKKRKGKQIGTKP